MGWYHSHPFDVDEDHDNCFFQLDRPFYPAQLAERGRPARQPLPRHRPGPAPQRGEELGRARGV